MPRRLVASLIVSSLLAVCNGSRSASADTAPAPTPWLFAGADANDSHGVLSPPSSRQINPSSAHALKPKWAVTLLANVSATPTADSSGVYVSTWGVVSRLSRDTGATIWSRNISSYTHVSLSITRNSPAISGDTIVVGSGGIIIAINKLTGDLLWKTLVETHPAAGITAAPVIAGNTVVVGVASNEESLAVNTTYKPTFKGSVVALDLITGKILWKFVTVPDGYAGGAVWGSNPVASLKYNSVFVGTGNNYAIPASAASCVTQHLDDQKYQTDHCLDPSNYVDSILAIDLTSGKLKWSRHTLGADTWTVGCFATIHSGCPKPTGGDYDFGAAPNLGWVNNFVGTPDDRGGTSQNSLLGAGQKNGIYWGLNPVNGGLFWSSMVSPGGILWGTAIDILGFNRVFVPIYNFHHVTTTLKSPSGPWLKWNSGSWAALNMRTGYINWEIPSPGHDLADPDSGAVVKGPISFTNGVAFGGASSGVMTAFNATTTTSAGSVLWTYQTKGAIDMAPAIYDDVVYWGSSNDGHGKGTEQLYAFSID